MQPLARILNRLQREGYEIGIVSWLSKTSTAEYDEAVTAAKLEWLSTHLASVKFNHIDIIAYGTPKQIGRDGILFDDEIGNREAWTGKAFTEKDIMEVLKALG
jgi:5'(3')-deoxyribonucleotidase